MSITATELKTNLSKYLALATKEDIYITQYGKVVAKLTNPYQDRVDIAKSLFGSVPDSMTLEELTSKIDKKEQQILKLTAKLNRLLSKDNFSKGLIDFQHLYILLHPLQLSLH